MITPSRGTGSSAVDAIGPRDVRHRAAIAVHPRVEKILDRVTAAQLEETLRVAFDLPSRHKGISPEEFLVFAAATLGVLMSDPDTELAVIRPRLASWWHRHRESLRAQGLVDYNPTEGRAGQ